MTIGCKLFSALLVLVACLGLQAAELVLVENGQSLAPIVLFADAPPQTRLAAEELATYIEKVSGAKPAILHGQPAPLPERAIWVGVQPVLSTLFPDLYLDFKHPEEIVITANAHHLLIAGRDRWDPDHMSIPQRKGTFTGKQQEYGTANAIYTFLQDYLNVRWLWPGEIGEDIVPMTRIAFAPFTYRYHPQIRMRSGVFHFSDLGNEGYGVSEDWVRRQRLQLSSLEISGGHGFTTWWEKYHEAHPDYFALQPDGTRSGHPSPENVKLCQSNPAVWQQWLKEVEAQLAADPTKTIFSASPNDGWFSGHCVCENCSAWDHPDGEMRRFIWHRQSAQRVALSDRHVTFANTLAKLLKERYPDKDYYVQIISYGHSRPVPIAAVPADNVIVASVANFLLKPGATDRGSAQKTPHREQFDGWAKVTKQIIWRPNTGSPAGWQQGQIDVPIRQVIDNFRYVSERGCVGILIDSVWEHWATQGPVYYVMGQLAWNPTLEGEAVLAEYYQRAFGPAAETMAAYWTLAEEQRELYVSAEKPYWDIYDAAFFAKAESLLDNADAILAADPKVNPKRIDFVRAGLDYTRVLIDIRKAMKQFKAEHDIEAGDKAFLLWEELEKIKERYPYAINPGPVRTGTPRMTGLSPLNPGD